MEKLKKEKNKNGFIAKNEAFVPTKNTKGITLVALVVTIVVLLILAGITITMLFGENGIIKKAQDAAEATRNDQNTTEQGLKNLADQMNAALGGNGGTGGSGDEVTIPEGLDIGSTVSYNPSGTYNWQAKYCSSTKTETTEDVTLSSAAGQSFNIKEWKVLDINNTTGQVTLVPSAPTTGKVYLGEAQGYNNGVKLLNEACSALYGNGDDVKARSIKIEDIEDYMKDGEKVNTSTLGGASSPYTAADSKYPVIYAYEKQSVITADPGKEKNLDLSDSPENFIGRTDEGATSGVISSTTARIQPHQTYWYKDASTTESAFKDYTKKDGTTDNYYSLIMPGTTKPRYWVASRCVSADSSYCDFGVRYVYSGSVDAYLVYGSGGGASGGSLPLFPVITLSSELIGGNATSGFSVN